MEDTKIQWCDSTLNIQMGCEGCELVKGREIPVCYAKTMTDRYKGQKGWPKTFEQPRIFIDRLMQAAKWKDLTGSIRQKKPWLNGNPRMIFLNDMGDTFSNGMPKNWFAEALPFIMNSPHIYMVLTKWPNRFLDFANFYDLPKNIWPGTTITSNKTAFRAKQLSNIKGGGIKWLSIEPMWECIQTKSIDFKNIPFIIYGGESGNNAAPLELSWLHYHIKKFDKEKIIFIKQLGSNVIDRGLKLIYKDQHAGNWNEWPAYLQKRQFPKI